MRHPAILLLLLLTVAGCDSVATSGAMPTAAFSFAPAEPRAGQLVTFEAEDAGEGRDGAVFRWDFNGDGQSDATGKSVTYAFAQEGQADVTLVVRGESGLAARASESVDVLAPYTQVTLQNVALTAMSFADEDGSVWEGDASPNLYYEVYWRDGETYRFYRASSQVRDVTPIDLPVRFDSALELPDLSKEYRLVLMTQGRMSNSLPGRSVDRVALDIRTLAQTSPTHVTLEGARGATFEVDLDWSL